MIMGYDRKYRCRLHGLMLFILVMVFACNPGARITKQGLSEPGLSDTKLAEYNYALTEATKQKLFGNFNQAVILFTTCLTVKPNSDIANYQLGNIYLMAGEHQKALKYTRRANIIDPNNYWYMLQLAQLYLFTGKIDSARFVFEDIVECWPRKTEISYELARIYDESGEYNKALEILDGIEKEFGISEPVSMLKEQIFVKMRDYKKAENELKKLLEVIPGEIKYLGILAELYATMKEYEKAEITYREIFEIEPDNGLAQLSYTELKRELNQYDEAFRMLKTAFRNEKILMDHKLQILIEYLQDDYDAKRFNDELGELIDILTDMEPENYKVITIHADYLVKNEKYTEALSEYDRVLAVEKSNYFIWEQAIFIHSFLGDYEQVYLKTAEAMKLFPEKPVLYLFNGNSLMQKKQYKKAVPVLLNGAAKVKNNNSLLIQFYSYIAESYHYTLQYSESDTYFEKAIVLDQNNLIILNNYSYYLALREENLEKAKKMSRKTIQKEPDNPTYLDTYAWVLYREGDNEKARIYIEKAIQSGGGKDPEILEHYGDILMASGDKEKALEVWKLSANYGNTTNGLKRKIDKFENIENK
jgi:tetratricopeptide (TPR) repeat protein